MAAIAAATVVGMPVAPSIVDSTGGTTMAGVTVATCILAQITATSEHGVGPYFTFGFNASRWRVLDFDFAIANGWYPGGCAYVESDPYHYGWYLLYDQQTGQYVHVEQY